MRTISVINLKGGVAKTISSINIAYILASHFGKRVLIIDNDKQGNTSKFFDAHDYVGKGIANIMLEKDIEPLEVIQPTQFDNLSIISANMNLLRANKEVLLDSARPQQTRLKKLLDKVSADFDFCIIDNAPDINMSIINALVVTDDVIIPVKIDKFAFDGLDELVEHIEDVKEFNPNINFRGCLITMHQKNNVNLQGAEWLRGQYPVFNTVIRKATKVDESTYSGVPLYREKRLSTAGVDYLFLVKEYLEMCSN